MTISKLCSLCKKSKKIHLFKSGDTQWAGDGYAYYALYGMPEFTAQNMLAAFGVNESGKDLWFCKEEEVPKKICVGDNYEGEENAVFDMDSYITINGMELVPMKCADRTFFVQRQYLKPLKMDEGTQVFYRNGAGLYYFIVKEGLFAEAMIMPVRTGTDTKEWMNSILRGL